jgi:hypothetical protein
MNVGRGAHSAISSCASTGMSPAFLLPNDDSSAPYFRKLPAIQWYSPLPVRFSTASPQLRRCSFAPPFAGRADEHDGEALVVRHRDERALP